MSMSGLSDLLIAIMAVGNVDSLDARDPRLAHRAIASVAQMDSDDASRLLTRFGVTVHARPDPDVGLRVSGLTGATWQAVSRGHLAPHEAGHAGWFTIEPSARTWARHEVSRFELGEADVLQRVGAAWASASTARKKRAKFACSGAKRSFNLA